MKVYASKACTRHLLGGAFSSFWQVAPLVALLASLALSGCQRAETSVGALCTKAEDCLNTAKPQVCAKMPLSQGADAMGQGQICTRKCASRTECPTGFECIAGADGAKMCFPCRDDLDCPSGYYCLAGAASEGADGGASTAKACQQKVVPRDDFKSCAVGGDAVCNKGKGFYCHADVTDDPDALCTKDCVADYECPVNMVCGTPLAEATPMKKTKRCLMKTQCSSCRSDVECPEPNSLCVPDDKGRGFCTRKCNPSSTRPCNVSGASLGHLECKSVEKGGESVDVCVPRWGSCYQKGEACDAARPYTPTDCQKKAGRSYYLETENQKYLGQSMCLQTCSSDKDCPENESLMGGTLRCRTVIFQGDLRTVCTASTKALGRLMDGTLVYETTCWP